MVLLHLLQVAGSRQSVADQEARLEFLEQQLAQLIQGSKVRPYNPHHSHLTVALRSTKI